MGTKRVPPVEQSIGPPNLLPFVTDVARATAGAPGLSVAAAEVAELVVEHRLADVAGVVMLGRRSAAHRLAASDRVLFGLDPISQAAGPHRDALAEGQVVSGPDPAEEERWPAWTEAIRMRGIQSYLLLGLPPIRGRGVALELYSFGPRPLGGDITPATAGQLATNCGLALRHADQRANFLEAMRTRGLIGEALGIMMERHDLTRSQAMSYLRRRSQHSQIRIRELADLIVDDRRATDSPTG